MLVEQLYNKIYNLNHEKIEQLGIYMQISEYYDGSDKTISILFHWNDEEDTYQHTIITNKFCAVTDATKVIVWISAKELGGKANEVITN
jgi:hypothetical protein